MYMLLRFCAHRPAEVLMKKELKPRGQCPPHAPAGPAEVLMKKELKLRAQAQKAPPPVRPKS